MALAYGFLHTVGGELVAVWSAFLITTPFVAFLLRRHFQDETARLQAEEVAARTEATGILPLHLGHR